VLHGFGGRLISEYFLERDLQDSRTSEAEVLPDLDIARRELVRWRASCAMLGPATSIRSLVESAGPLITALGFAAPSRIDLSRPDCATATVHAEGHPIVLLVTSWSERLDPFWRHAVAAAIERSASWALLFNGVHLRLIDPVRAYARRYFEFDLDLAIDDERTFAILWSLLEARKLRASADGTIPLRGIIMRSESFASGVSRSLRTGVLAASADVVGALLKTGKGRIGTPIPDAFEQALTIVYRILFLLFAEARGLVPLWHPVYRDSYSIESLRAAVEHPAAVSGLWESLRAISRLAHSGCRAGNLRVTPFNGRLFAPQRTPLVDRPGLDDEAARRAVLALSTRPAPRGDGFERIAYRDLGVEQLGAVYETLLDYEPRVSATAAGSARPLRPSVVLVRGSNVRKSTGSFYTPQPIADYLVRRTLGPLVAEATPERILRLRVVDPAAGSGAFLVAACRYLADAYEAAQITTGGCHAADFGERERVLVRRTIAERCLFGVDLNPMAVQLARLSLWLATLAADRPLTFLDHHLQAGDSLSGVWLNNLRRSPAVGRRAATGDVSLPLFDDGIADVVRMALPIRFRLSESGDSIERVREKERALAALNRRDSVLMDWKRVADVWCAPWFQEASGTRVPPSAFPAISDAILHGAGALPRTSIERYLEIAASIAASRRFFHWELEFPEVFFATDGSRLPDAGFDAVIGNPPWDMIRNDPGAARTGNDAASFVRFTRESGVYAAQSEGHANCYQLFLERSIALTRTAGRLGIVLPAGLLNDHGSAALRRRLFDDCDVDALVGFTNERGVFPIHRSVRFVLVTASRGSPTRTIACRFGEHDPGSLEHVGPEPASTSSWFTLRLSRAWIDRVSGDSLLVPDVRDPIDVAILERVASSFPRLGTTDGWNARFGRELNATEDREHFGPPGTGLPVVEGRQIQPFGVDIRSSRFGIEPVLAHRLLGSRSERPRLAYRDVAGATNRQTLIAAIVPSGCVSTHTVFCLRTPVPLKSQHFLCGLFNSFVLNYLVRLRVTTHVTTAVVEDLPIPLPHVRPRAFREIAICSRMLTRGHNDTVYARLQALVARLYQLSVREFAHVLGTFPLIPEETRRAALTVFRETFR